MELIEIFGNELTIVNAARASFGVTKTELDDADKKLIKYLITNKHMSPFRHVMFRVRIHAPEFVMRQLYKHVVGIETSSTYSTQLHSWNEISGRYIKFDDDNYYIPTHFRNQSTSNKQASHGVCENSDQAMEIYLSTLNTIKESYNKLIELGVCKEQARIILPLSMYSTAIWTCSLQALINFIELRNHEHAQVEIRGYAIQAQTFIKEHLPFVHDTFFGSS